MGQIKYTSLFVAFFILSVCAPTSAQINSEKDSLDVKVGKQGQPALQNQEESKSESAAEQMTAKDVVGQIVKAANVLLDSIDDSQREKLIFSFTDNEQRERWSNLPEGIFPRSGLRMGDLTAEQKQAVYGMLKATLSEEGFQQVIDNMNGDEFLKINGRQGGRVVFGNDEFFVSILGEPSTTKPWMWQFGGHHLAINATIVGDHVTLSPSLTGGQPIDYEWEGKSIRQLSDEIDSAYELIGALDEEQLKQTVLADQFTNLNFGPRARSIEPRDEGILISKLTEEQQELVKNLIQQRIGILNSAHTKIAMEKIVADFSETYFSWYGSTKKGEAATYRIQGPSVIIEYAPQQMGRRASDHIHAMYRDPSNDYGTGFIKSRREK